MSYAVKALHEQYPNQYITDVETSANAVFDYNPYITKLSKTDRDIRFLDMTYSTIHSSNQKAYHFVNAFLYDLAKKLNINLLPIDFQGSIFIGEQEKSWYSAVHEWCGSDPPYWIIDAGHKWDFTAKAWDFERYQAIIDRFPDLTFVQIGQKEHNHPKLNGKNLLNLVGKTDLRQLIRLVYNSFGVITPTSLPMVLAYAVPPHPRFKRKSRACVVVAGGREPNHWQAAPNHQFLHTCGMLDCCDLGGCWKSRVVRLNDQDIKDNDLCIYPVKLNTGQYIAKCMDMITVDDVCLQISRWMENLK